MYYSDVSILEVQPEVTADVELFVLQVHIVSYPSTETFAIENSSIVGEFLLPYKKKKNSHNNSPLPVYAPPLPQNQDHMAKLHIKCCQQLIYCIWRWRLQLLRSVIRWQVTKMQTSMQEKKQKTRPEFTHRIFFAAKEAVLTTAQLIVIIS